MIKSIHFFLKNKFSIICLSIVKVFSIEVKWGINIDPNISEPLIKNQLFD